MSSDELWYYLKCFPFLNPKCEGDEPRNTQSAESYKLSIIVTGDPCAYRNSDSICDEFSCDRDSENKCIRLYHSIKYHFYTEHNVLLAKYLQEIQSGGLPVVHEVENQQ